jgi:hypothetical protein
MTPRPRRSSSFDEDSAEIVDPVNNVAFKEGNDVKTKRLF